MTASRTQAEPGLALKAYLVGGLLYPFWRLAAPGGPVDPWAAWWIVGASFAAVIALSRWIPFVGRHLRDLLALCTALVTLHLFALAALSDMQPFYAVGSALAVVTASFSIRSRSTLLAYGLFAGALGAVLFALAPDVRKLAYWGGMLPVVALAYQRLSVQLAAAELTRQHQETLEQRVRERTWELTEANRLLQREMAERVRLQKMEAVGRLAGGIAHDFNNLLTTIGVYVELLLNGLEPDSPLRREGIQIQKAARQAATLTQQLLTFSREADLRIDVLDLNEVIRGTSSLLQHLVGEDIELVCRLADRPQRIRADAGQLEQVLVNLVLNARDATQSGGRLTIETVAVTRDALGAGELPELGGEDACVLLAVSDTGVGMDAETRARAFDPFFTRKPVGEGTGLGLSIVYGIVKQGGGHARVLSEPGRGARFELYWPCAAEEAARSEAPPAPAATRGRECILLVEDEVELRHALHTVLRNSGYTVIEAEDAEAALRAAARKDEVIDLVLTDVVMPHMSGLELVEELAALRPDAKVLLVSGHLNHPSLRDRDLPAGLAFLPKPFLPRDLTAKVREVLDARA